MKDVPLRNKTTDEIVVVPYKGAVFELKVAKDDRDFTELMRATVEAAARKGQLVPVDKLRMAVARGHVVVWRKPDGEFIGFSQLILGSIEDLEILDNEAWSFGSFLVPEQRGRGQSQILYRAEEVLARKAAKQRIVVALHSDDYPSIGSRLRAGYRITGYCCSHSVDWDAGGFRLVMTKELSKDPEPFSPGDEIKRIATERTRTLTPSALRREELLSLGDEVALSLLMSPQHAIFDAVEVLLDGGYIGVGLIPGTTRTEPLLLLRRARWLPDPFSVAVGARIEDEFSPLTLAAVSHPSFVSQIDDPALAINAVALRNVGRADPIATFDEYEAFTQSLLDCGVSLLWSTAMAANERLSVFPRDPMFVVGDHAFIAALGPRLRASESTYFAHLFSALNPTDVRRRSGSVIEGGDVVVLDSSNVAVGLGSRTNPIGANYLARVLGDQYNVVTVSHEDLHLDVIFAVIGDHLALVDVPALSREFLSRIAELGYQFVESEPSEHDSMACNVLAVADRKVIAHAGNTITNRRLEKSGVEVVGVDMRNVVMRGGGPRCMTCPIRRGGARAETS